MFRLIRSLAARARQYAAVKFLVLSVCFIPVSTTAEIMGDTPAPILSGLIWNRTGLPAVFPLQVKTPAGENYFLKLVNERTKSEAIAAFIVGGSFFKVLVPPGTYTLQFSFGNVWQGEEHLFGSGANTETFELQQALTFQLRGGRTKAGHLVDLTDMLEHQPFRANVKAQSICQTFRTEAPPPVALRFPRDPRVRNRSEALGKGPFVMEKDQHGIVRHLRREAQVLPFTRFEVRSSYCD